MADIIQSKVKFFMDEYDRTENPLSQSRTTQFMHNLHAFTNIGKEIAKSWDISTATRILMIAAQNDIYDWVDCLLISITQKKAKFTNEFISITRRALWIAVSNGSARVVDIIIKKHKIRVDSNNNHAMWLALHAKHSAKELSQFSYNNIIKRQNMIDLLIHLGAPKLNYNFSNNSNDFNSV
jgi:hypothetical protein